VADPADTLREDSQRQPWPCDGFVMPQRGQGVPCAFTEALFPSGREQPGCDKVTRCTGQALDPGQLSYSSAPFRNGGDSLWVLDQKSPDEIFGQGTGVTEVFFPKLVVDSGYIG
jgi:hypothetical protein